MKRLQDTCCIYTKTENEPLHSFSLVTSVMSIQFLRHDQDGQILLDHIGMAPITSHTISVSASELLHCFPAALDVIFQTVPDPLHIQL